MRSNVDTNLKLIKFLNLHLKLPRHRIEFEILNRNLQLHHHCNELKFHPDQKQSSFYLN